MSNQYEIVTLLAEELVDGFTDASTGLIKWLPAGPSRLIRPTERMEHRCSELLMRLEPV